MLKNLYVKNLALIKELDIDFEKGLNILTGETGAGKSILLGSINLALGEKASFDMVREGASSGLVELTFMIEREDLKKGLEDLEIDLEEDVLILSRKIREGRSVSRINGEVVTKQKLQKVAELLIDIHGQHEHQSLLYKRNHLPILDNYIGEKALEKKKEVGKLFLKLQEAKKQYEEKIQSGQKTERELDLIRYEAKEIEEARLKKGEDEELESLYKKMGARSQISSGLEAIHQCLFSGRPNVEELLSRSLRQMREIASQDEELESLYEELSNIENLLGDFQRGQHLYERNLEFSQEEFEEVEQRLNQINRLKQKYGPSISRILEAKEEREKLLEEWEHYEEVLEGLKQEVKEREAIYLTESKRLSELRKEAQKSFSSQIEQGLKDLNFESVQFELSFQELENFGIHGIDEVEFLISLNPGISPKPLNFVASGGELSRIMLVIKSLLSRKDGIQTLVFDEIDVGISGRTAQKVSEKMAFLGKEHQVLCVTHLAQIAAMADVHFLIAKIQKQREMETQIKRLNETEEIEELARILGGAKITKGVKETAVEMKALASQIKNEI